MPTQITIADGQTVVQQVTLGTGQVKPAVESLKIDIGGFKFDIGGFRGIYSGVVGQAVVDDDTSFVYLNKLGALVVSLTGFSAETHIPLARVVTANGEIVAIYEERVLLASSSSSSGLCRIGYPVDGGIRGGGTTASTNNDMPAVRFDYTSNGWNRMSGRPPQNYLSGNLTLRLVVTVPTSPADTTKAKWQLEYCFRSIDDDLGAYETPVVVEPAFDGSPIADDLWAIDFTIPSGDFDKDADLMFFKVTRLAEDATDDCGKYIYVHAQELRYTGLLLAGQAGQ